MTVVLIRRYRPCRRSLRIVYLRAHDKKAGEECAESTGLSAYDCGFRVNDIIVSVNGCEVHCTRTWCTVLYL